MRGRVAAVLLSLLSTLPAFSQCNVAPVASAQFRSTILDLALDGSQLWAATSYGLALYDAAVDPPPIVATIPLPGTTRAVRASGGTAYAASGSTIQIVRWSGTALQRAAAVDAGAAVNDLAVTPRYLYAATANGIAQYDLINPSAPAKTSANFATSSADVAALELAGDTLYAVDGDASVEVFNLITPAVPQKLGAFNSLARPASVSVADGRIYVSDGQQTEVFVGSGASPARAGEAFPFGATSVAALSSTAIFAAGSDRRLRGFDLSSAGAPVQIFQSELAPTSGTVNRVTALAAGGQRLYAAAGDIGLLAYDLRQFVAPFPMRSYATIATNSVAASNTRAYFGRGQGIVEYVQSASGALTEARSWDKSRADVVHDVDNDFLLTSSGATATLWALSPQNPTVVGTATFPKPVLQAVLAGTTGYAVLDDRTLWTADLAQLPATPQKVSLAIAPQFIARSGSNIALADLRSDGTTIILMLGGSSVTLPGLATGAIALSGTTVAAWTFRGISLISFPSGATTLLPGSNTVAATRLAMNGTRLAEMTDSGVVVWDTAAQRAMAAYALSSASAGVAISPNGAFADLATFDGVAAVQLAGTSRLPSLLAAPNANFYAKKVVAAGGRVVLFDGRSADIFDSTLAYRGGIHAAGTVDVAASDAGIFTLTNTLGVNAFARDGEPLGAALIVESGASPQAIHSVGTAVWASIVRGCPLNCEKKTIVFDARGALWQTATMNGAVRDVAVSGARAYVLSEVPDEIRVLDVSDPAHPREIARRAVEGSRLPVSIAYANGVVYVLGDKLYTYDQSLAKTGEPLGPYADDPTLGVTYADQRVRVDGGCLAITGRAFSPQLFTTSLAPQPGFPTPSAARAIAAQPGRLYVLTDHSLEVWGAAPLPKPARRRAAQ